MNLTGFRLEVYFEMASYVITLCCLPSETIKSKEYMCEPYHFIYLFISFLLLDDVKIFLDSLSLIATDLNNQ